MLALVNFVETDILASLKSETHKWIFGASLAVLPRFLGLCIDAHMPFLQTLGVMTEDNCVDTEMLRKAFDSAFKNQPTLPVSLKDLLPESTMPCIKDFLNVDITFTKKDTDKLLELAEK